MKDTPKNRGVFTYFYTLHLILCCYGTAYMGINDDKSLSYFTF